MNAFIASQITSLTMVYSTVYSTSRSKKTSKLCVTGLCEGNSPMTGEFPAQMASNAENISVWWCHHGVDLPTIGTEFDWGGRASPTSSKKTVRASSTVTLRDIYNTRSFKKSKWTQSRVVLRFDICSDQCSWYRTNAAAFSRIGVGWNSV